MAIAEGSFSTKKQVFACSMSAPMPRIPVPAPKSITVLSAKSPNNEAACNSSAAICESVVYCSALVFAFLKGLSFDNTIANAPCDIIFSIVKINWCCLSGSMKWVLFINIATKINSHF